MDQQNQESLDRLSRAAEKFIKQERWSRRWMNLVKMAVITYFMVLIFIIFNQFSPKIIEVDTKKHMAVVKLNGPIMPNSRLSAETFNPLLAAAFKNPYSKAVVIQANSPGGSPVQASLINQEITRLKEKHNKPVFVVVEDVCASGCYYIAVAADRIYANEGSIIGSIGVRMSSFGFTGLMDKIGIENRSMHAGNHKTFIDPFSEEDKAGRKFFQERILERTHQQFIAAVRNGRGDRIKENQYTFSGLVWLGDEAIEKGLIDGLADMGSMQRDIIQVGKARVYATEKSFMEEIIGNLGAEVSLQLQQQLSPFK